MTVSLNTLKLCRQLLGEKTLSVNADRDEITAVLDARDELDAAIAAHPDAPADDSPVS